MNIPISDAQAQLTELVRRAEAGEEINLTRLGRAVVRLAPLSVKRRLTPEQRMAIMDDISKAAQAFLTPGPDAAHSQDFLYDENGLPA